MKKNLLSFIIILFVGCGCLFAEHGFEFSADSSVGVALHPLVSEMVGYKYTFSNNISLGGGLRLTENLLKTEFESLVYIVPYVHFGAGGFFINGGTIVSNEQELHVAPYFVIGGRFGKWAIGPCTLDMSIALEVSPMLVSTMTSDTSNSNNLGNAIETLFLTVVNIPKIQIGAKLYLPI